MGDAKPQSRPHTRSRKREWPRILSEPVSPFESMYNPTHARTTLAINYIVDDMDALLDRLKQEGVKIDPKRMDESYGRFAWIYDLDGNKIELWQPSAKP